MKNPAKLKAKRVRGAPARASPLLSFKYPIPLKLVSMNFKEDRKDRDSCLATLKFLYNNKHELGTTLILRTYTQRGQQLYLSSSLLSLIIFSSLLVKYLHCSFS